VKLAYEILMPTLGWYPWLAYCSCTSHPPTAKLRLDDQRWYPPYRRTSYSIFSTSRGVQRPLEAHHEKVPQPLNQAFLWGTPRVNGHYESGGMLFDSASLSPGGLFNPRPRVLSLDLGLGGLTPQVLVHCRPAFHYPPTVIHGFNDLRLPIVLGLQQFNFFSELNRKPRGRPRKA